MNVLKEIFLNHLIKIPAIKKIAQTRHQTGISSHPEHLDRYYAVLTKYSSVENKNILELGPGKTVDIVLRAKNDGAAKVAIADVEAYLTEQQVSQNNIEYKVYDGRALPFPDESFDYIWSTTVFEHLRFPSITIAETYRLLRPGGRVVHLIDLIDHFSYGTGNPELTFNCLKYPKWLWELMTRNRSTYVNRIRATEWITLHENAGFKIISSSTESDNYIRNNYLTNPKLSYLSSFSEHDAITTGVELVAEK